MCGYLIRIDNDAGTICGLVYDRIPYRIVGMSSLYSDGRRGRIQDTVAVDKQQPFDGIRCFLRLDHAELEKR